MAKKVKVRVKNLHLVGLPHFQTLRTFWVGAVKKHTVSINPFSMVRYLLDFFGKDPQAIINLVLDNIDKTTLQNDYNHIIGLQNINIDIPKNKIQVFMGLSGSGKSTLIRHLNQLIRPTHGEIIINGVDVTKLSDKELMPFRRQNFAMVFQKFALLPHRTVLSNTYFGLQIKGIKGKELEDTAMYWIKKVGLEGFENYHPNQLSGGMQQRVGIARALANDAPIILMDEPFSALDPLIRIEMQDMLIELQKELKKTIIFITHDLDRSELERTLEALDLDASPAGEINPDAPFDPEGYKRFVAAMSAFRDTAPK